MTPRTDLNQAAGIPTTDEWREEGHSHAEHVAYGVGYAAALRATQDREATLREALKRIGEHECWDGDNFIRRPFEDEVCALLSKVPQ